MIKTGTITKRRLAGAILAMTTIAAGAAWLATSSAAAEPWVQMTWRECPSGQIVESYPDYFDPTLAPTSPGASLSDALKVLRLEERHAGMHVAPVRMDADEHVYAFLDAQATQFGLLAMSRHDRNWTIDLIQECHS